MIFNRSMFDKFGAFPVTRDQLTMLMEGNTVFENYFNNNPLCDAIKEVSRGSFKTKQPPEIKGSGFVIWLIIFWFELYNWLTKLEPMVPVAPKIKYLAFMFD